jgi:hypothetical protein
MTRTRWVIGTAAATVLLSTACGADRSGNRPDGSASEASPGGQQDEGTGTEESAASVQPVDRPPADDPSARYDPALFGKDSATIDNPWWPLAPGMMFTYEGVALDEDSPVDRKIVDTVVGLSKDVDGVDALVLWERDYNDGDLSEGELSFLAQDEDGNVWHLGEYTELYEDDEFVGGRVWVPGDPEGAQAGIIVPGDPQPGDESFAEGFAPPPYNWYDRARVRGHEDETCVEAGCFEDVVVVEEFEPSIPDAFQLKYYARGVGHVKVGWDGANEEEQEELELTQRVRLSPAELASARAEVLAMDLRANAYSRLGPATQIS